MAVFMDHRCQAPYKGQMTDIQWHKVSPILAVASQGQNGVGMLNFFLEEVRMIFILIRPHRPLGYMQSFYEVLFQLQN